MNKLEQMPPFCQTDVVCSTVYEKGTVKMEVNKIYNEDCLETLKRIPTGSVDLMLTDIPYGTTACEWDSLPNLNEMWIEWERIVKSNGVWIFTGNQPMTTKLISSKIEYFKCELIWEKPNPSNPLMVNKQPLRMHENILVFYKEQPTFNIQKQTRLSKDKRKQKEKTLGNFLTFGQKRIIPSTDKEDKIMGSVLYVNREQTGLHPTQKPVELFIHLIRMYSNENDLVFDGYMGSGTTAIACIEENRRFLGSELNKEYYDKAIKRIEIKQSQPSLFAGR